MLLLYNDTAVIFTTTLRHHIYVIILPFVVLLRPFIGCRHDMPLLIITSAYRDTRSAGQGRGGVGKTKRTTHESQKIHRLCIAFGFPNVRWPTIPLPTSLFSFGVRIYQGFIRLLARPNHFTVRIQLSSWLPSGILVHCENPDTPSMPRKPSKPSEP